MQARVQAAADAAAANTKAEKDSDSNNEGLQGLLVAGAGAAAVALVGYLVYRAFSSPAAKGSAKKRSKGAGGKRAKKKSKKNNKPKVELSVLLKIFDDISVSMKQMMLGFAQYEQKIRKEYKGKASEAEIVEHLNQMFLGELSKVEKGVYERHGHSEEDVKAASDFYKKEPEFVKRVEGLHQMFSLMNNSGSSKPTKEPEGFDMQRVMGIVKKLMGKLSSRIPEIADEVKAEFKITSVGTNKAAVEEFNRRYFRATKDLTEEITKENNISQDELSSLMIKYGENPEFKKVITDTSMEQQRLFEAAGLVSMQATM